MQYHRYAACWGGKEPERFAKVIDLAFALCRGQPLARYNTEINSGFSFGLRVAGGEGAR